MHDQILHRLVDNYFLPRGYRGTPDFIREFHHYVMPLMRELPVCRNTILFTQHNIPNYIYFLLSGVAYSSMGYPHRSMPVAPFLWHAPAVIGDGRSFYRRKPARFGVAIQGFARVYSLERKYVTLIEEKFPDVHKHIRLAIKQEQKAFKTWKEELHLHKVPFRLARLKEERPELFTLVLKKHLAAHLGIHESYFSTLIVNCRKDLIYR